MKRLSGLMLAAGLVLGAFGAVAPGVAQDGRGGIDQVQPRDNEESAPERGGEQGLPERDGDAPDGVLPGDPGSGDGGDAESGGGQADAGVGEPQSPLALVMKDGIPKHAEKRATLRDDLYALLASAGTEKEAKQIAGQLQRVWAETGSDTTAVLMARATNAVKAKDNALALELLDAVVELAPDHAEAWNRRAYVHFQMNNYSAAAGDLRRALALDQNHFKALDGLATIFQQLGDEAKALSVYEKLKDVHPFWPGVDKVLEVLRQKVEGRGI